MWRACERGRERTITEVVVAFWSLMCSRNHIRCACYLDYTEERRGGAGVEEKGVGCCAPGECLRGRCAPNLFE